jgi:hypothetical protein
LTEFWRGRPEDVDLIPGYVTATRPGMPPGDER